MGVAGFGHHQVLNKHFRTDQCNCAVHTIAGDHREDLSDSPQNYARLIYPERLWICSAEDLYNPTRTDSIYGLLDALSGMHQDIADIIIRERFRWLRSRWLRLIYIDVDIAGNVYLSHQFISINNIILGIFFSDAVIYVINYEVTI